MGKLWEKGYDLDKDIEAYTVGIDYILDRRLIPADCAGSMAHGEMLASIGVLTDQEVEDIRNGLTEVVDLHAGGEFPVTRENEDGHTAIEGFLIKKLGETGKKIHTGRSRNDQVLTALRLYTRAHLLRIFLLLGETIGEFRKFADANSEIPMPGRTHLQKAMPSTVGLWAAAFGESLVDDFSVLRGAYRLNNRSPLGAAASYGVPLPLNRELTAELLGFDSIQNNVLYVNNSRGKIESLVTDGLEQIMLSLSRCAQDLILFSLPEFGYFSLPRELCSGSSIMPQKKNPDALELLRGKAGSVSGWSSQIKNVIRSMPGGYNRDLQETKEPLFRSLDTVQGSLGIMKKTIALMKVNSEALMKGMTPEVYATDRVYELVNRGMSFRDAYREIGTNLEKVLPGEPGEVIRKRVSTGTSGNLNLSFLEASEKTITVFIKEETEKIDGSMKKLFGKEIDLLCSPGEER